ncbi:SH3 domain-containing protein [Pararhodobacter sp.]|uniref:SH3 domain-containing protein n=1 Tax=Pararhodobacter sp. TaxID=2127056 RepID=UPI002FDEBEDB
MRHLLLIFVLLCAGAAAAQDYPSLHRVTGVASNDVLNIREEPAGGAPIIGQFRPGQRGIEVMALSENGRWGLVNSGERAGWSSMRYLTREGAGSWRDGQTALNCLGTEPFWRMPIFLPTHRAEFHAAGEGGFELVTDTGALPTTEFPPVLAIPFSGTREGMAVVRGELCSDGMSDMAFGLRVQVFWRGDTAGLSGCCRISD